LLKGDETLEYLAEKASKGNEECFVMICSILERKLFRAVKDVLGNDTLSLDAVSEAVFRAFRGIKKLKEPKYVETWFIRILLNAANDIHRRQKNEIVTENVSEGVYLV
jgi:DNA-directed RNA polymerase specialized sigma24 family protein